MLKLKKNKPVKEQKVKVAKKSSATDKIFTLLSAYYALELKTRNYHWNVECHHFTEYHKFFEEMYDDLADEIDEIAEQIRKLGEKVPATLPNFVAVCEKNNVDMTNRAEKSSDMILCLLDSNNKIIEMIKDLSIELDGKREYFGTCSLLDELLGKREKTSWFLSSMSK